MSSKKVKQFDVDSYTVTIDADVWPRVQPLVRLMRAATPGPVFLVNHGTKDRPVYQPLAQFILNAPGAYVTLKDRSDPANHRRSNLVRA
jgi:hypothetical protein